MKLISMTDFILKIDEIEPKAVNFSSITDIKNYQLNSYSKIVNYANFLKQPLKLGMFVPCDENDVPLESCYEICACECDKIKSFRKAKERVIFEGFELINDELVNNGILFWVGKFDGNETIENCISSNLKLTDSAIKKYNL